jgi:hypothetical protein
MIQKQVNLIEFSCFFFFSYFSYKFLVERFTQLQEAKEVLCDDVQRKAYDYWRNSHITVPWKTWHSISERSQPVRKDKRKNTAARFLF